MIADDKEMVVMTCCSQPPDRLDHPQPVRGLHPGPFQPIIENRIFVGREVQLRRRVSSPAC